MATADIAPKLFADSPLHLLHRAVQVSDAAIQRRIDSSGLTSRQLVLMSAVAASEGASQTKLVAMTGMDRSTMADVVRRMVKKGLIKRVRRKTDARAYEVRLTARGHAALKAVTPEIEQAEARMLAALPVDRAGAFCEDLHRIVAALDRDDTHESANGSSAGRRA